MKKLAAIALAILMMAAVAAGCGGDNGATDATNASTEKPTNSVKVPTKETDETDESDAAEEESTDAQEDEQGDNSADDEENQPASTQSQVQETEPPYVAPDTTEAPYVEPEPTDPPVQGGTFTSSDAYFSYNGVTISIGSDINNIVAAIGSPSSTTEADSCYGEGKDIAYHYGSFTINTIPSNGVNIVNTVSVNSTPKGVSVGQSESAIVNAYGNSGKVSDYLYSFSNGGTLNFYLSGGTITAIEYC